MVSTHSSRDTTVRTHGSKEGRSLHSRPWLRLVSSFHLNVGPSLLTSRLPTDGRWNGNSLLATTSLRVSGTSVSPYETEVERREKVMPLRPTVLLGPPFQNSRDIHKRGHFFHPVSRDDRRILGCPSQFGQSPETPSSCIDLPVPCLRPRTMSSLSHPYPSVVGRDYPISLWMSSITDTADNFFPIVYLSIHSTFPSNRLTGTNLTWFTVFGRKIRVCGSSDVESSGGRRLPSPGEGGPCFDHEFSCICSPERHLYSSGSK